MTLERDREALKAVEAAEWEARHAEVARQAEAARQERKRRRAEAERAAGIEQRSQVCLSRYAMLRLIACAAQ